MRRILAQVFLLVFAVFVAACGSGDDESNPTNQPPTNPAPPQPNPADAIVLGNPVVTNITSNSFSVTQPYTDDQNQNAIVTLYFCNATDIPICNPLNGQAITMSRNGFNFIASLNSLSSPNDPGDSINIRIVASDNDGVSGSPQITSTQLLLAVIFQDGFETGDRSIVMNGTYWENNGAQNLQVNTRNPRTGSYAFDMIHRAKPDGQDSSAEQSIVLGNNQTDLWMRFYLYVPPNYIHRTQTTGHNNKFLSIYRIPYGVPGFHMNFSTWPDGNGGSYLANHTFHNGSEQPIRYPSGASNFISANDLGKWMKLVVHVKAPDDTLKNNGVIQMWKNDILIVDYNDVSMYGGDNQNYINKINLLGYSNSGYAQETVFTYDDLVISSQPLN